MEVGLFLLCTILMQPVEIDIVDRASSFCTRIWSLASRSEGKRLHNGPPGPSFVACLGHLYTSCRETNVAEGPFWGV